MSRRRVPSGSPRARGEHGALALITALVAVVLLVISAFVVDIGSTWARRGQLQRQADQAALLAAESLPAVDQSSRRKVAQLVAYYVACHTVVGQRQLDPAIPECPENTTPETPAVVTYAQRLLDDGSVTFPTTTQVKVVTPAARIDYGFGRTAGVDGSTQRKMAIAKVSSPGDLVPVGLSLECLLTAAGSVPVTGDDVSGVVPINYITPGPLVPDQATTPTSWPGAYTTNGAVPRPSLTGFTTTPTPVVSGQTRAGFTVTGSDWGLLNDVRVVFHRGPASGTPADSYTLETPQLGAVGSATASGLLPDEVMTTPGRWEVKVGARPTLTSARTWSDPVAFDVAMPAGAAESLGCARMLKSPRADVTSDGEALERNLQEGLDHGLVGHPNLVTVTQPGLSVEQVLQLAASATTAFGCSNSTPNVLDVRNPTGTPNCVLLQDNQGFVRDSFTDGVLGAESGGVAGRLVCTQARPCDDKELLPELGVEINTDDFDDFVEDENLLNDAFFFNLSTYLDLGVPVATPRESALSDDIYSSHRFMWAPVIGSPLTPNSAGHYPVLTFRPIFITQDAPDGWETYDALFDGISSVAESLGLHRDDVEHGLLRSSNGRELKAMRFMTIEPSALPLVTSDYNGPTSEYLGAGPKIVRLVR